MIKRLIIYLSVYFIFSLNANSQTLTDTLRNEQAAFGRKYRIQTYQPNINEGVRRGVQGFSITGNYRLLGYHRNLEEQLYYQAANSRIGRFDEKLYNVGDYYREPMLWLTMSARPGGRVSFGSDLYIFAPYEGMGSPSSFLGRHLSDTLGTTNPFYAPNLGATIYSAIQTNKGTFNIHMGGIMWERLSDFTMGAFAQPYNRFVLFERLPWEPVGVARGKYANHHNTGLITQEFRFGMVALQGITIMGNDMPHNLSFKTILGRTQAGISFERIYNPSMQYGGSLTKKFGSSYISLNTFNSYNRLDSIGNDKNTRQLNMVTSDFGFNVADLKISGETGMGSYASPLYERNWSPAVKLKVSTPAKYTLLPIDFGYYYIGRNFVNPNGAFANTTIPEANASLSATGMNTLIMYPTQSPINQIGFAANNRQAFNINTGFEIGELKIDIGNEFSRELERSGRQISFGHRTIGLAMSRIYFPFFLPYSLEPNYGPYNNFTSFFRGVGHAVTLTDVSDEFMPASSAAPIVIGNDVLPALRAAHLKNFNTLEIKARYKVDVMGRAMYFHYLGSQNSVQKFMSPIPVFSEEAYLRVNYNEFENFFNIHDNFTIVTYYGRENARGNNDTYLNIDNDLNPDGTPGPEATLKPMDLKINAFGLGFDWDIARATSLYVRHRWFNLRDDNFPLNKLKGQEFTVELKMAF